MGFCPTTGASGGGTPAGKLIRRCSTKMRSASGMRINPHDRGAVNTP